MGCYGNDPGTFPASEQSKGSAVLVFLSSERCREKSEEEDGLPSEPWKAALAGDVAPVVLPRDVLHRSGPCIDHSAGP